MKSYEYISCTESINCGDQYVCGRLITFQEDMSQFQLHNVGPLNTGWIETGDSETGYTYLYVNVDNVTSSTLDIVRIQNNIIVDIPNIYGTKLVFDSSKGELKLIGRDLETVLSTVNLPVNMSLTNIEYDTHEHTITFKFNNHEDIVLNIYDILEMNNYYTREEIDAMFGLHTSVSNEESVNITIQNNTEISYTNLHSGIFTIPENAEHGYMVSITLTSTVDPSIEFKTNNELPIKYIMDNNVISVYEMNLEKDTQYNFIVLCNGLANEVYIQRINS